MPKRIQLEQEMITLGQFLKFADLIDSGGQVRHFLTEFPIRVNGDSEDRRGRKLYPGDLIEISGHGEYELVTGDKDLKS